MPFILLFGAFAAVSLAAVALLGAGQDRREVRLALRTLNDYELSANVREQELLVAVRPHGVEDVHWGPVP